MRYLHSARTGPILWVNYPTQPIAFLTISNLELVSYHSKEKFHNERTTDSKGEQYQARECIGRVKPTKLWFHVLHEHTNNFEID